MVMLDVNGRPYDVATPCLNGPYRARYLSLVAEIAARFDLDGLFVDGPDLTVWFQSTFPTPCYCEACLARWARRYRAPMPRRAERVCREPLLEFLEGNYQAFMREVLDTLRARRPQARLWHNSSFPADCEEECFHEVDAYHRNFYRPSLFIKRHQAVCGERPRVSSLSLDKPLRHTESGEMMAWELATYLAHKPVELMVWSTPELPTMWYKPEIEQKVRFALEAIDGLRQEMAAPMQPVADVAVAYSRRDIYRSLDAWPENWCTDDVAGLHRLLSEAHVPFAYVDLDRPFAPPAGARVLVAASLTTLPRSQVAAILRWVKGGGNVLATAAGTLPEALPGLKLGPRRILDDGPGAPVAYCQPEWDADKDAWSVARGYFPLTASRVWQPMASILPLAVPPVGRERDNTNRPAARKAGPGAVFRRLGRGSVIYFNHEVFAESINRGVNLFRGILPACLERFGVQPRFEVRGCLNAEATYYRTPGGYKVVLTNGFVGRPIHGNGEPAPWGEISEIVTLADLAVLCRVPVNSARSRRLGPLEVQRPADGAWVVPLPKLALWDVISLVS
jgi:hypothetical protein